MSICIAIHSTNDCGWGDLRRELSLMEDVEIQVDSKCQQALLDQVRRSTLDILISGVDYNQADPVGFLSQLRNTLSPESKMLLLFAKVKSPIATFVSRAENLDALMWSDLPAVAIPAFVRSYSAVNARIVGEGYSSALQMAIGRGEDQQTVTPRQLIIVGHLALGKSYSEISSTMCLSYRTVARDVERLMEIEDATSLFQLAWKLSRNRHVVANLAVDHLNSTNLPQH